MCVRERRLRGIKLRGEQNRLRNKTCWSLCARYGWESSRARATQKKLWECQQTYSRNRETKHELLTAGFLGWVYVASERVKWNVDSHARMWMNMEKLFNHLSSSLSESVNSRAEAEDGVKCETSLREKSEQKIASRELENYTQLSCWLVGKEVNDRVALQLQCPFHISGRHSLFS